MDSFRRDGLTFDVLDAGPPDGDPVVLLHGFPQDATAWSKVAPALHQHGLRTLSTDQRGYSPGARPSGRSAYRLRELTADVLALLDSAGLGSAHVVGHDWGGIVAWALGARHPERVRTLTAISVPHPAAMARAMVTSDQALRSSYVALFQLPVLPERLLTADRCRALRHALTRTSRPGAFAPSDLDRYVEAWLQPGTMTGMLNWYRALARLPRATPPRVRVPTLILWGKQDTALQPGLAEASLDLCEAGRIEWFDQATHWLPHEEPAAVNAALRHFLT